MPDLIAQGPRPEDRWRRSLPEAIVRLGRKSGCWSASWDNQISREHADLTWLNGELRVQRLQPARNPLFFRGKEVDRCSLQPGDHFVIGQTTFTLTDEQARLTDEAPAPVTEQSFDPLFLQRVRFRNADQRIEALSRLTAAMTGAASESEVFVRLVNTVLAGIPGATAVAVVAVAPDGRPPELIHWDRRLANSQFSPSQRLIQKAVAQDESVVHLWRDESAHTRFTQTENVDWAFCTPVLGDACAGMAIYVAGQFSDDGGSSGSDPQDLRDDLKFTELAATLLRNLTENRRLEDRHVQLRSFFSPIVLEAIGERDFEQVLSPRETEVCVMFCDLRGFSRTSEREADNLIGLLERVSQALGVMTHHILDEGGVVGDFHGDAAMGFWGWPLAQQDFIERTGRAALGIRHEFELAARQNDHVLSGFRMGIGIATGRAVAGKIGTIDQVKVSVFGPVVNLASRLEGMTRYLNAPILLDETTANAICERVSPDVARVRRLARVKPYGLESSLEVSELLPPEEAFPDLTDAHVAAYEQALDALSAREWDEAFRLLHSVPASDRAKDFLTIFIAQHNRTPPPDWDGIIPLASK